MPWRRFLRRHYRNPQFHKMKPENVKSWVCKGRRTRFVPPSAMQAPLQTLTGSTSATLEQVYALRELGAPIPARIENGKLKLEI